MQGCENPNSRISGPPKHGKPGLSESQTSGLPEIPKSGFLDSLYRMDEQIGKPDLETLPKLVNFPILWKLWVLGMSQ